MHLRRPLRRTLALAAGAVVLTVPLTSCGFDYATDRVYTPGVGTNARGDNVDVLGAVIVAAREGSGTLSAGISNGTDEEVVLSGLTSTAGIQADFEPVTVPANGYVDLAAEGSVQVTGEVVAGDFVDLTLEFEDGSSVDVQAPVVTNCDEYEGIDVSEGEGEEYSCEVAHPAEGGH